MATQKIIQAPIKNIRRDHEGHLTQIREELDQETVETYAEHIKRGDEFPPIELIKDDGGKYFIVDGWHRLHAHERLKRTKIGAVIHPPLEGHTPAESAIRMALNANLKHGLRLSRGDERKKARAALSLPQLRGQSDRTIAKQIGISHQTVGRARNDMAREGLLPNPVTGELVCDSTPEQYTSIQAVKNDFGDVERFREVLEFVRQLGPFDEIKEDGFEDYWSFDKRNWSFDPETQMVSHQGLKEGKVVIFAIEGNAVTNGKPQHYQLEDAPEQERWRPEDIDAARQARWEFEAAAKRLRQTGKADLIKAVEILVKYRTEPGIFSDIRTLVTYGGPASEHTHDEF